MSVFSNVESQYDVICVQVDQYSMGVMMYELWSRKNYFEELSFITQVEGVAFRESS